MLQSQPSFHAFERENFVGDVCFVGLTLQYMSSENGRYTAVSESYCFCRFSMVGVHLTPRVDGRVLIGPNAALALAKEGYNFWSINIKDAIKFGLNLGLWKLVLQNPGIVFQEVWRDINTRAFVREAQRCVVELSWCP